MTLSDATSHNGASTPIYLDHFVLAMSNHCNGLLLIIYVVFVFCSALLLGFFKAILVGPVACLILLLGNVGVILGLFPAHFYWTAYTVIRTDRYDVPLKVAILFALPPLFVIWLGLSIAGSVLVAFGYGFLTPWVSTFEAFRCDHDSEKLLHCLVDGTWGTILGSCTAVRDFTDICYHSYPVYLKELRHSNPSEDFRTLRFIHVPACIVVGVMGLIVEVTSYTGIAIVKSPYMLFKGWQRLLHDLVSREGPFLETACIPIAGLIILVWPIVVLGSIIMAIFSSVFIGLYGSVIVYQERSFRRGVAYVIAMIGAFDEYTNDVLSLREGTIFPKPRYRKNIVSQLSEGKQKTGAKIGSVSTDAPALMVPCLAHSRSFRETLQEVKMVQIWGNMMRACEQRGKELLDSDVLTGADLYEWLRSKDSAEGEIIGIGLPCYTFLQALKISIRAGVGGLILSDGVEVTNQNRPKDKLLDWFFQPILDLKEQIKAIRFSEGEMKFLEKVALLGNNKQRMDMWENGISAPPDAVRAAQIQGISRRMMGMMRSVSKLPTYRRKFQLVVKTLVAYSLEKESSSRSDSLRSFASPDVI